MTGKLKFALGAVVYFAWVGVGLPLLGALSSEEIYDAVSPATVTLEVKNAAGQHFVGSAFLALGRGLAVTAWHVVHDAQEVEAHFSDDRRVKVAGLVDKNEGLDLALIKLETDARPMVALNSTPPRIGSRIYVLGAPKGFDFSISEGIIGQIRTLDKVRYYQVSCPISAGDSGGPLLNQHGEAIGVMSWRKADAESVSFAIPSADIARLNPALPPVPWQMITTASPRVSSSAGAVPLSSTSGPDGNPRSTGGFLDLKRLLSERIGKRVSITVQDEDGQKSRFSFAVPNRP
jgi:S1-C subfamily serine protease